MAITQLVPRILEQSLFEHFPSSLTGMDREVRFNYVTFDPGTLNIPLFLSETAVMVDVIKDGVVVQTANSINELVRITGVMSRNTLIRYINHITLINTSLFGLVNLKVVGFEGALISTAIVHRTGQEHLLDPIKLNDYSSLDHVPLGLVFIYDQNKVLARPERFVSIVAAAKALNPSDTNTRGMAIIISRFMNLDGTVRTELGDFYFVENPSNDRFASNHEGRYPCVLHDLETGTIVPFAGLRPIVKHLAWFTYPAKSKLQKVTYDRLKTCYDRTTSLQNAKVLFQRFIILPTK